MSADFAKIVRASDGAQVLFYKDSDGDGPALQQVTEVEGVAGAFSFGFTDDDEGYDKRDAAFEKAGVEEADALRALVAKALEGASS
jgi:hypothetical protein